MTSPRHSRTVRTARGYGKIRAFSDDVTDWCFKQRSPCNRRSRGAWEQSVDGLALVTAAPIGSGSRQHGQVVHAVEASSDWNPGGGILGRTA